MNATGNKSVRPWGWVFALAIALMFATVILGVLAIGLIEKRKQRLYRLRGSEAPGMVRTNSAALSAVRVAVSDGTWPR
jgi:hypothetical protein